MKYMTFWAIWIELMSKRTLIFYWHVLLFFYLLQRQILISSKKSSSSPGEGGFTIIWNSPISLLMLHMNPSTLLELAYSTFIHNKLFSILPYMYRIWTATVCYTVYSSNAATYLYLCVYFFRFKAELEIDGPVDVVLHVWNPKPRGCRGDWDTGVSSVEGFQIIDDVRGWIWWE